MCSATEKEAGSEKIGLADEKSLMQNKIPADNILIYRNTRL